MTIAMSSAGSEGCAEAGALKLLSFVVTLISINEPSVQQSLGRQLSVRHDDMSNTEWRVAPVLGCCLFTDSVVTSDNSM